MKLYPEQVVFQLGGDPVTFTPEGCISIVDVIRALAGSENPQAILKTLMQKHPEIEEHIRPHRFDESDSLPVTDGVGLDLICALLFDEVYP